MAWLQLQGIEVPINGWETSDEPSGSGTTQTGHQYRSDAGGLREMFAFTAAATEYGEEFALLVVGAGEVFSDSDFGSKGTPLETAMATSGSAKFGTHHFAPPSAPDDFVDLNDVPGVEDLDDGWTVLGWYNDGGGYVHYGVDSDGTKYEAGAVDAGATVPFSVDSAGMLTLDSAGDYDDIVVLPYVLPTGWIGELDLTVAWAGLPTLNASGDFWFEAMTVEAADEVKLTGIRGTSRWTLSGSLLRVGGRNE